MSCDSEKMLTKKKIIMFTSIGLLIATATYLVFTTTNNPAIAAALPALVAFAACPLTCAAVDDIIDTVHVFPTMTEAIKLVSTAFKQDVAKLTCCVE